MVFHPPGPFQTTMRIHGSYTECQTATIGAGGCAGRLVDRRLPFARGVIGRGSGMMRSMRAPSALTGVLFRRSVTETYRRVFRPPWEVPAALIGNALLMTAAWFLLPPRVHDWLFALHGPLAFPVLLATWMLADTPSTNVVGHDRSKALSVLNDGAAFRTWLTARCLVLTSLVGPPCALVALAIGVQGQHAVKVVAACVVLVILPLGILPVAAWLGLVFPYNLRPLRWRWQHRSDRRTTIRWGVLLVVPYLFVPAIAATAILPSIVVAHWLFDAPEHQLTQPQFVADALMICATALVVGWLGLWVAGRLRQRRHDRLTTYLLDSNAG